MYWETLLELVRHLAAAPPAIAAPVMPAATNAESKPECVDPQLQYTYSDWQQDSEQREFDRQWVTSTKQYSRTVTDNCNGTTATETKTEGPYDMWQAVPDQRVADVNRPSGSDDAVTGTPLLSTAPLGGVAGMPAVGPQDRRAEGKSDVPMPGKSDVPPFYPGALVVVGAAMAAVLQKKWSSIGSGPDPDVEQELLDLKVKQYQDLARRRRWDVENPQFSQDPDYAGHVRPFEKLTPETQAKLKAWQKQWQTAAIYWKHFFAGVDSTPGAPPVDPWGMGDSARAQAAEALQGKLSDLRAIVYRLAADPDELDTLAPAIADLGRSIEHFRSVLPSEETEKMVRDIFAGDEVLVGHLVVEMKKRQYRELARAGWFELDYPQFTADPKYAPFDLLKPLADADSSRELTATAEAWKAVAPHWRAWLKGEGVGAAPDDALGIREIMLARVMAAKRQQRWEAEDQSFGTAVPKGTALDQKRMARWAKADQGTQNRGDDLTQSDWRYIESLLAETGKTLDKLGPRDQWELGKAGKRHFDGAFVKDGINYSQLITDEAFTDYDSMSEQEIREFIADFPDNVIKNPNMPVWEYAEDSKTKVNSGRTVDVAHLIFLCSRAFRINPKVLLTKLEKEESLLTGKWQGEQIQPDWKMMMLASGFGVTDGQQQTSNFRWSGVDRQIVLAAWLTRCYFNDRVDDFPAPREYPFSFTTGEGPVPLFNRATWVLYMYTPHTVTADGQGNITFAKVWDQYFGQGSRGVN